MPQPNLLQRAKQGDSDAIAALMNLTLQDKGVAAKVVRIQDYLHISFRATKALNQNTLVEFVRQGLQRLEVESIQTVKVYGLKTDAELPDWVTTFQLGVQPASEPRPGARNFLQGMRFDRASLQGGYDRWAAPALSRLKQSLKTTQAKGQALLTSVRSRPLTLPTPQDLLPPGISLTAYVVIAAVVTVGAFTVGGMVAGLAISHGEKSNKLGNGRSANSIANANGSESAQQQAEVKQYLAQMIESQKLFYQQNQRLAKDLEELERSAAVVSHSYNYIYRVSTATPTQFQLVATAKNPGFRSYTAIVTLVSSDPAIMASLCETNQPTQVPPIATWTLGSNLQCPAGANKVQ